MDQVPEGPDIETTFPLVKMPTKYLLQVLGTEKLAWVSNQTDLDIGLLASSENGMKHGVIEYKGLE